MTPARPTNRSHRHHESRRREGSATPRPAMTTPSAVDLGDDEVVEQIELFRVVAGWTEDDVLTAPVL